MFDRDTEELAENKLLLLFIMKEVEVPLTGNEITRIVLENNFMNYFALQQFLSQLSKDNFITYYEDKGKHYYRVEKKGLNTLSLFVTRIPQKLRQEVLDYIAKDMKRLKKEKQITGRYTMEDENQYLINLKMIENQKVSLDLNLRIFSHKHARKICNNWNKNAPDLYGKILNLLIDEEN